MKKIIMFYVLMFLCVAPQANANEFYIDGGFSVHDYSDDVQVSGGNWLNALGTIEAGYEFEKISVYIRHTSSLQMNDRGLNQFGFKMRLFRW